MRKKTEQLTAAIQTASVSEAIKTAANNFLLIDVSVSFWSGVGKFSSAAEKAAIAAGAAADGTRMYKDLLGEYHCHLKSVNEHYRRVRTTLADETIPFAKKAEGEQQRRGKKMVNVLRYPDLSASLIDLKDTAEAELSCFLANYDEYRNQALSANFGVWRGEAERLFPTAAEVAGKFAIQISDPAPLPVFNAQQTANWSLPASMLGKIVERSNSAIAEHLEGAKQTSIDASLKVCEVALKQLTDGKRFNQSIIVNVKREAIKLREMADGYDNDPRIQNIADTMLQGIANVSVVEGWKSNETKKSAARHSAATTVRNLKRMQQSESIAAPEKSEIIMPDIMTDLI